jgi:hypothetical protein
MFVLFMVLHLSLLTNVILPSIASFSLTASRLKILPRWLALPLLSLIGIIIAAIGYAIIITNTLRFYTLSDSGNDVVVKRSVSFMVSSLGGGRVIVTINGSHFILSISLTQRCS